MSFRIRCIVPFFTLILFALAASFTLTHCSDDKPVEPPPPPPPDTTSHEFVWEVDTLFFEGTNTPVYLDAKAMYGTSASNVYLAGYSNGGRTQSWHWDGQSWKTFNTYGRVGSIIDIDGIDSSFIVLLGDEKGSRTAHEPNMVVWDNNSYGSIAVPLGDRDRTCIHVVSRNEFYLGGIDGIQRYNGSAWEWMLDTTNSLQDSYGHEFYPAYICKLPDGNLEFVSQRARGLEQTKYYRWQQKNDKFAVVDTFSNDQKDYAKINFGYTYYKNSNKPLSASFGGIFLYKNGGWRKIHELPSVHIAGIENDLFTALNWGEFRHFNGNTWKDLYSELTSKVNVNLINSICSFDGTVFLAVNASGASCIVRGRKAE